MHAIKVRIWDTLKNQYRVIDEAHDIFTISRDGTIEYYNLQNGSGGSEYIVELFTGEDDQCGKNIYEGDVLKFKNSSLEVCTAIVQWAKDYSGFAPMVLPCDIDGNYFSDFEVIGNIHENPELIILQP